MHTSEQEIAAVSQLLSDFFAINIYNCYGLEIKDSFRCVLRYIPMVLKNLYLNKYQSVRIFKHINNNIDVNIQWKKIVNFEHLAQFNDPHLCIQILGTNNILVYSSQEQFDISNILETTFVYEYSNCQDIFHTNQKQYILPNISGSESYFTVSTFKSLDEALDNYQLMVVPNANCAYIERSIYDKNRIFLKSKPEHNLRDSLKNYLRTRLRGENLEIRAEQNIDDTHPVDIKITWGNTNHIALIEIKWLGHSINEETLEFATSYSASRANNGAKQLVDYLDENKKQVPNHNTQGYLVVYDLRRRGVNKDTRTISTNNGFYYKDKEIEYDPDYSKSRDDFHLPIRFFIEPRCEDVS